MTEHPRLALPEESGSPDPATLNKVNATARRRLSVPNTAVNPRPLTDDELAAVVLAGDLLIPRRHPNPAFSELDDRPRLLTVAVAALAEHFDDFAASLAHFTTPNHRPTIDGLRELEQDEPAQFFALSAVICGTYFMSPHIRTLIGIPGLKPHPASIMAAADDLDDGILEPVVAMGATYTPTDDCPR